MAELDDSIASTKIADDTNENGSAAPATVNGSETDTKTNGNCDPGDSKQKAADITKETNNEGDGKGSHEATTDETETDHGKIDAVSSLDNAEDDNNTEQPASIDDSLNKEQVDDKESTNDNGDDTDEIVGSEETDSHIPTLTSIPEDSQEVEDDEMSKSSSNANAANTTNVDEDDDDDEIMSEVAESKADERSQGESTGNSTPVPSVTAGADDVSQESSDTQNHKNSGDDGDEAMATEDCINGAASSVEENGEEEIHAISDSEDEEVSQKPEDQRMEVDSADANGLENPVSIGSDSNDAPPAKATDEKENGSVKGDVAKRPEPVEDEDEDCVVIEDDAVEEISPRRGTRSRKSVLKSREMTSFDEDIEEITDEPISQPPPAKKIHLDAPPAMNITIQDARSLALDPLANQSFQNHLKEDQARRDASSIQMTEANSIMGRSNAASVQALQNQNISVRPVTGAHHSPTVYPTNIRASITPVTPNTKIPNNSSNVSPQQQLNTTRSPQNVNTTAAAAPLLPALTDDMFVLEAPSFIVPYIYEKPPPDNLRDIVENIRKELADQKKQEDVEVAEKEAKELEAMTEEQRKLAELAKAADANKKKSSKKRPKKGGDDSWGESDTSTDDETSDTEQRTKVLIKEADNDLEAIKSIQTDGTVVPGSAAAAKRDNYFESPLGKFFMDIAVNLVQEHVQTDLLRQQKKKLRREGESAAPSVEMAINSLTKNLEHSKQKNQMYKFETKRCEFCSFKSESALAMAHHYEAPHLNGQMYKCNFCPFEARPPYDILFHIEAIHNVKARLDKAQTYHQCPNCPFEDNGKSKLARHALVCVKKYRPEINLNPPLDWEPPAKIPRIKPRHGLVGTATAYQAMAAQAQRSASHAAALQRQNAALANAAAQQQMRGRGRPQSITKTGQSPSGTLLRNNIMNNRSLPGISVSNSNSFQMNAAGQFVQAPGPKSSKSQQPSISITPLPRQSATNSISMAQIQAAAAAAAVPKPPNAANIKPGQNPAAAGSKSAFVICEICDGYIKDLDQLRNHMQWMHKVKIHPKMIYNRPPLNCQKCQFRFFTDQGLERHLLGSHGLVTSSMQEAANKGKDAGRCPVCGRMYQWKLLNHVSRDHNMTLKPAHLSYKCTVCTATFGMYKQFENHVYSAHSNVAKKAMDAKNKNAQSATATGSSSSSSHSHGHNKSATSTETLLRPLKINDEITIIPQPAHSRQSRGGGGGDRGGGSGAGSSSKMDTHVIEIL